MTWSFYATLCDVALFIGCIFIRQSAGIFVIEWFRGSVGKKGVWDLWCVQSS